MTEDSEYQNYQWCAYLQRKSLLNIELIRNRIEDSYSDKEDKSIRIEIGLQRVPYFITEMLAVIGEDIVFSRLY